MKYAGDTYLLVPENTNCTLLEEFEHIKDWATTNKMVINMSKTKELVFHRPHPTRFQMSVVVDNIEEVKIVVWHATGVHESRIRQVSLSQLLVAALWMRIRIAPQSAAVLVVQQLT